MFLSTKCVFAATIAVSIVGIGAAPSLAQAPVAPAPGPVTIPYYQRNRNYRYNYTPSQNAPARATTARNSTAAAHKAHKFDMKDALDELGLSEAQRSQINVIQNKASADSEAIYENRAIPGGEAVTKMQAVDDDMRTKIEAVLTPTQHAKFASLMSGHHSATTKPAVVATAVH